MLVTSRSHYSRTLRGTTWYESGYAHIPSAEGLLNCGQDLGQV